MILYVVPSAYFEFSGQQQIGPAYIGHKYPSLGFKSKSKNPFFYVIKVLPGLASELTAFEAEPDVISFDTEGGNITGQKRAALNALFLEAGISPSINRESEIVQGVRSANKGYYNRSQAAKDADWQRMLEDRRGPPASRSRRIRRN